MPNRPVSFLGWWRAWCWTLSFLNVCYACGVYEGTAVRRRAVLGTGTILNRSTNAKVQLEDLLQ